MVTTRPPKTIVKSTALGPVANTDTKLLIYGLFQKGRVLAQDGVKIGRSDPLHRLIIGRIYYWAVRIAFGLSLSDVDCDFRLFRRSIFDKVVLTKDSGVICVELMKKVQDYGFRIQEVPVHHFHRYCQVEVSSSKRAAR